MHCYCISVIELLRLYIANVNETRHDIVIIIIQSLVLLRINGLYEVGRGGKIALYRCAPYFWTRCIYKIYT